MCQKWISMTPFSLIIALKVICVWISMPAKPQLILSLDLLTNVFELLLWLLLLVCDHVPLLSSYLHTLLNSDFKDGWSHTSENVSVSQGYYSFKFTRHGLMGREFRVWKYHQNIITLAHPSPLSFLLLFILCNSWTMTLRINLPNRAYQHKHYSGKRVSLFP